MKIRRSLLVVAIAACSSHHADTPDGGNASSDAADALCTTAPAGDPGTGPYVGSACGTWTHGSMATLTGVRFGTKSEQQTYRFDDASGSSLAALWDYAYPSQNDPKFQIAYRAPSDVTLANGVIGGVPLPHAHGARYIAGAHYGTIGTAYNGFAGGMVALGMNGQQGQTYSYISYYRRIDPSWLVRTNCTLASDCDHNFKEYDYAAGYGPYGTASVNIYFDTAAGSNPMKPTQWQGNYAEWPGSTIFGWNPQTNHGYFTPPGIGGIYANASATVAGPGMRWQKVELVFKHGSDDGYQRIYQDNKLAWDVSANDDGSATGPISETVIGGYAREYGDTEPYKNNWRYYADIYYDHSLARVMLANAADYTMATIVEPQPHVAWADGSIQITVNLGALSGGNAYLFVIDPDGTRAVDGLPVAIGQ
jgi:hypothetical protein